MSLIFFLFLNVYSDITAGFCMFGTLDEVFVLTSGAGISKGGSLVSFNAVNIL